MIRQALKSDASRIAEILIFTKRKHYRNIFQDDYVSFHKMQVLPLALSFQEDASSLMDMDVYDDGIVKGLIHWDVDTVRLEAEIKELYVDTFFHGEHIGTALLEHFEKRASDAGIHRVYLWCLEKNMEARIFYEKRGYMFDGTTKKYKEETSVILRRYGKIVPDEALWMKQQQLTDSACCK